MSETEEKPKTPFYQYIDGFPMPGFFSAEAYKSALAYKPRADDLFIVTYPKCGTTWVQHLVGNIFRGGKPFDSFLQFLTETPFLEMTGAKAADTMNRPGAIKLHLPFRLTPWSTEAKYIFVARNPKDCVVSFYHHTENIPGYKFQGGEFDDYFELFMEGKVDFGDYFDTLLSWYEHRNDPNVLFITYEQLKKDTKNTVMKIAEFMGPQYKEALEKDEDMLKNVIYYSSFQYMKENSNKSMAEMATLSREEIENNPDIPDGVRHLLLETKIFDTDPSNVKFVRKGIVGDWKNYFSPMQNARLEKKYRERTIGTDIPDLWRHCM